MLLYALEKGPKRKTTTTKPPNPGKLTAELRDLATW